jgi:Holliday junction resolvase RusA-like endonuclease
MHFAQRTRLKKATSIQLTGYGDPIEGTFAEKSDVKITRFYGYRKRQYDLDNLYGSVKLLLDAMRELGIILGDTPHHINLVVEQEKSPDKSTFVQIEVNGFKV